MDILTDKEKQFLIKMEQQKQKHNEAQAKYRLKNLDKIKDYNSNYFKQKQEQEAEIKSKLLKQEPTKIDIDKIIEKPIINKTSRGALEIIPSFKTRKDVLELSTINDYIKKANIIHKIFKNKGLSQEVKRELNKLLNDNKNIDEKLILDEMDYINDDIDKSINILRDHYKNDNTFKTYINILVVITSHFKSIHNEIYQKLTKIANFINDVIQTKRGTNILDDKDNGKIIDLNNDVILSNIQKLNDIEDRLIYGLYTLQPARRLDYRNMKITLETNDNNLNDINYLKLSSIPYQFVFNDYKTFKAYGKQIIDVDDDLMKIINLYIDMKGLKNDDYLFSLSRNKKEIYDKGAFSNKISKIFKKIYKVPISVRFLRMSWSIYINSDFKRYDFNERKKLIRSMAHSIEESQKYFKDIDK